MASDSPTQPVHRLLGTTGGSYQLESLLGSGALGMVYLAHQEHLGRSVAVKFLREPYASHPQFRAALRREARAGCRIDHPNVARTYDVGQDQHGHDFLVMELLRGASLETVLQNVPCPPLSWTVSIVAQVLAGLAAAHERGVIHRDVKPSNVMIETTLNDDDEPTDIAKLCDFGIAEVAQHSHTPDGADFDDEAGFDSSACGTPNYMSPEQAQGEACSVQSDIYSCGVMLFELVTGRPPFLGPTSDAIAMAHVHEAPPRPRDVRPDINAQLERIILCAISKRPQDRFGSAREMRGALLALPYARQACSLLDDWADAPAGEVPLERELELELCDIERQPTRAPRRSRRPSSRRSAQHGPVAALLCGLVLTLGAALACQHLPRVEGRFEVQQSSGAAPVASAR